MTPQTIEALREAASKATPGPWDQMKGRELVRAIRDDLAVPLFEVLEPYSDPLLEASTCRVGKEVVFRANSEAARQSAAIRQQHFNAAFIALANPATILSLLDERTLLREAAKAICDNLYQDEQGFWMLAGDGERLATDLSAALGLDEPDARQALGTDQ